MIKALIFDFDGVLVSSDGPRLKFIQELGVKHGVEIEENVKFKMKGKTTQVLLQELFPNNPELVDTMLDEFKEYRENITKHVEPIDFTVKFIRNYQGGLPIAIASMSSKQTIERLVKHFGINEKIALIVSKDEVTRHKPDPEIYRKTANDLGVSAEKCLVFEDTRIGVQAAVNANMPCCGVLNGENRKEEFEAMKIQAFVANEADLRSVIEKGLMND